MPKQVEAVVALDWLLNEDNRRQGRSMALAVALIRQALRRPRQRIGYMDHLHALPSESLHRRGECITRQYVEGLIRGDPRLQALGWNIQEHHFWADLPAPIHDWWPDPASLGPGQPNEPPEEPRGTAWDQLDYAD